MHVSEAFYYKYPISTSGGTKEIIGVSVDGADELANMIGNIKTLTMEIRVDKDSDPDYCYAMVPVLNTARNTVLTGVGRACKFVVDKGNRPLRDRNDDHWFVKAIGKGQRNAILKHVPEEIITQAVAQWSQVKGKGRKFLQDDERPAIKQPASTTAPYGSGTVDKTSGEIKEKPVVVTPPPTTAPVTPAQTPAANPVADAVADAQKKINLLRISVHEKFQKTLLISTEKRGEMLAAKLGVGPLSEMSVQQLQAASDYADELIKAKGEKQVEDKAIELDVIPRQLGFNNAAEQKQLAQTLYSLLISPTGLAFTPAQAPQFLKDRNINKSTDATKTVMLALIKEANDLIETKKQAATKQAEPIDDSQPGF